MPERDAKRVRLYYHDSWFSLDDRGGGKSHQYTKLLSSKAKVTWKQGCAVCFNWGCSEHFWGVSWLRKGVVYFLYCYNFWDCLTIWVLIRRGARRCKHSGLSPNLFWHSLECQNVFGALYKINIGIFQLVKPFQVKVMYFSFLAPNCRQEKQKHASSLVEYFNQVRERYQLGLNAWKPWLKMCMGYVCRTGCIGVLSF